MSETVGIREEVIIEVHMGLSHVICRDSKTAVDSFTGQIQTPKNS